jgi:hypothetical protein
LPPASLLDPTSQLRGCAGVVLAQRVDVPAAAAEEIQRRREEIGFSYVIVGADVADTFAPVVATLAGQ